MKNLEELYAAELKNIYAMEKQIQTTMDDFGKMKNEKLQKRLEKFTEHNDADLERIQKLLKKQSVNPGSTTDSVANEILLNLTNISSGDYSSAVKEAGLVASFIRLSAYKTSNYINAYRMAKTLEGKRGRKKLSKSRKYAEKDQSKFAKIARREAYKAAI